MPVKDPGKRRSTALAVAIVFALSGAGVAVAWAASEPGAQARDAAAQLAPPQLAPPQAAATPSPSAPGSSDKSQGKVKARELHGESVVKKADGSFEKRLTQTGTVESVSDKAITVKSEDGFSQEYVINAGTRIGKAPKPAAAAPADLKQGDTVRVRGIRDGSSVTATVIVEGAANGKGLGQGLGKKPGHGLGRSNGQGKGLGQGQG
jgi:hypothetical protein